MFWLLLIFAALFLVNSRANYRHGKFAESGAGLAIAVCLCGLSWYVRRQEQQRRAFVSWLEENLEPVVKGGHWYGDYRITAETELRQYEMAVSFLVATVRMESRYYFSEVESGAMASVLLTLGSLVLGWWGLPHGPFVTLRAIGVNLRGGKRLRVQHLIDGLTGHKRELVRLTQRAADHARFLMRTRGFPATTALQVEIDRRRGETAFRITFDDQPPKDGSVFWSESSGVKVIVPKQVAEEVDGLLIDADGGEFLFKPGPPLR